MSEWTYDVPWRPNFEAVEVAAWTGGMVATASLGLLSSGLPFMPFACTLGIQAAFALKKLPKAIQLHRIKQRLGAQPVDLLSQDKLLDFMIANPTSVYLGQGYQWTQSEGQMLFDLLKRDVTKFVPKVKDGFMGAPWIHGLSQKKDEAQKVETELTSLHELIVGTTGSGKTRLFDLKITQAVLRGEAVIVIDPKGDRELAENTKRACEIAGEPNRFKYFHPAFPEKSTRVSPTKNFSRPTEVASRIAALMKSEAGNPFQAFAMMAINNVVQAMLICGEQPTLVSIRRALEGGLATLIIKAIKAYSEPLISDFEATCKHYLKGAQSDGARALGLIAMYRVEVQPVKANSDLEGVLSMYEHDSQHFGKMIASLMPVLNMLTSGHMGPLLSPMDDDDDDREVTDTKKIIDGGQVMYLGLDSLSDPLVGSAIGSIFLADLASVAGERYNYGVSLRPVSIFVDEAAEVVNDQLIQLLNKGRGAKLSLYVATQTIADFEARMGDAAKARQVLGNTNHLIALRITDPDTQEYVASKIPPTRYKYIMRAQGASSGQDPHMHSGNVGERLMEEEGELFPSQMFGQLPNLEYIAIMAGGRLIKGKVPVLTTPKDMAKAAQQAAKYKEVTIKNAA